MEKRGQVSIFVIIGIVIVIVFMLFWYLNQQGIVPITGSEKFLSSKIDTIKKDITSCASEGVKDGMNLFGKQGGTFSLEKFLRYKGYNVRYYCTNIPKKDNCLNHMPLLEDMRKEFENYMGKYMDSCVNPELVKPGSGYDINAGDMKIAVGFEKEIISVKIDYDVVASKEGKSVSLDPVDVNVDVPIGGLYNAAHDIIEAKATIGGFDQNVYMIQKYGLYEINVDKPYPDIVYMVNKKDNKFELWFAIEGGEEYIA